MAERRASSPEESPTRQRILNAAERLFAEDGYGGTSMPAIAAASGITAGAIYKHFASKEELFFLVVKRAVDAARIANDAAGGMDRELPRIVADYTTERLERVRRFAIEIHAASANHPRVRRLLRLSLEHNIEDIRTAIEMLKQAGRIDPASDSTMLARAILVFIMGLMHMETLLPDLIDDPTWHNFVEARVGALLGMS